MLRYQRGQAGKQKRGEKGIFAKENWHSFKDPPGAAIIQSEQYQAASLDRGGLRGKRRDVGRPWVKASPLPTRCLDPDILCLLSTWLRA